MGRRVAKLRVMPADPKADAIASVPASRALVWYGAAMRLWKRGPVTVSMLAVLTVLAQIAANGCHVPQDLLD